MNSILRIRSLVAALAVLSTSGMAQAQARNCLTEAETAALIGYALPDLLAGVRDKCKGSLAAPTFLMSRSAELERSYRRHSDALWPTAKAAFAKMVGEDEMMKKMPDSALRPLLTAAFGTVITNDVKASDCPLADGIVEALAPLPPANLARLIGLIIAADDKGSDAAGKTGFAICE